MDVYPRRQHFDYFRSLAYPYLGVSVDVDVTALVEFCRSRECSFYLAFMHAAAKAANGVSQLRQRIRDGGIVEYDVCPTSHTEMKPDGTYCYCTLHHDMPMDEYLVQAETARQRCRESGSLEEDEDADSMLFISTLPWLNYNALIQPVAGGDESNPRITWGKYKEDAQGRLMMPVTLLAHHALADGLHVSEFFRLLEKELEAMTAP